MAEIVDTLAECAKNASGKGLAAFLQIIVAVLIGYGQYSMQASQAAMQDKFAHIDSSFEIQRQTLKDDVAAMQAALDRNSDALNAFAQIVARDDAIEAQLDRRLTVVENWKESVTELRRQHMGDALPKIEPHILQPVILHW